MTKDEMREIFELELTIYKKKRHNHGEGEYTDFLTLCVFEGFCKGIEIGMKIKESTP